MDQNLVPSQLPVAEGASFDSHAQEHNRTCLPNARVELLREIANWAKDPVAESIFWLNGMAGTEKSTISRTVAQSFATKDHLGASFFKFKRGKADRASLAKFFTTTAADLVVRQPATAPFIKEVLEADPSTKTKNAREQFDKLFLRPLSNSPPADNPIVIIIDALDECERDDDIKLLIYLFSHAELFRQVKIFLTSRPELPLRLGFRAVESAYQHVVLHEMPANITFAYQGCSLQEAGLHLGHLWLFSHYSVTNAARVLQT